jgi:hypothetical protein
LENYSQNSACINPSHNDINCIFIALFDKGYFDVNNKTIIDRVCYVRLEIQKRIIRRNKTKDDTNEEKKNDDLDDNKDEVVCISPPGGCPLD